MEVNRRYLKKRRPERVCWSICGEILIQTHTDYLQKSYTEELCQFDTALMSLTSSMPIIHSQRRLINSPNQAYTR